jgi:cysteine desulfurase
LINLDLKGLAVSSGSACSSGTVKPSSVLSAMNISNKLNISTLRISFGKDNTVKDVDVLVEALTEILKKYKKI